MVERKIGDRVFVVADNFGEAATVIDERDGDSSPPSRYKVRTDSGDEFWAFDFEIHDLA